MIPRILDYEDGRILITPEAYSVPEIKALIDKHDMKAEPYLAYVHLITSPDSPYINVPEDERREEVIFSVIQTYGDFDIDDELLQPAIDKLTKLYTSKTKYFFDSVGILLDSASKYARSTTVSDENLADVNKMIKEAGANIRSYKDLEKQVDEELKTKMRGKNILGDYYD